MKCKKVKGKDKGKNNYIDDKEENKKEELRKERKCMEEYLEIRRKKENIKYKKGLTPKRTYLECFLETTKRT